MEIRSAQRCPHSTETPTTRRGAHPRRSAARVSHQTSLLPAEPSFARVLSSSAALSTYLSIRKAGQTHEVRELSKQGVGQAGLWCETSAPPPEHANHSGPCMDP